MPKVLARGIAAVATLAALAAARPAVGGAVDSTPFSASFKSGGTISLALDAGVRRSVRDITVLELSADCEMGRRAKLDFEIYGTTPVQGDRRFAVRSEDKSGKGKAVVRGRFNRSFSRVNGSARLFGKFRLVNGEGRLECASGNQEFVARVSG